MVPSASPTVRFHLLGQTRGQDCLMLQRRLTHHVAGGIDRDVHVLFTEHTPWISVGRSGSRSHIRVPQPDLQRRGIAIEWSRRGGGAILHQPGQLGVYAITSLENLGWSAAQWTQRLQDGVRSMLDDAKIKLVPNPASLSIWGRSGILAAFGIGIDRQVTSFGFWLNVNPDMRDYQKIDTGAACQRSSEHKLSMGSLLSERRSVAKMSLVRSRLTETITRSLGAEQHHVFTGHAWLPSRSHASHPDTP